jgi:general secretion pathway protein H
MTNPKNPSVTGFTLIELLIVMVIISVVSTVAMLTISHNQNTRFDSFAKQLTSMMNLAEEQAMLKPAILGLHFTETTYQFYEFADNTWHAINDHTLGLHHIPDDTQVTLKIRDKVIADDPDITTPHPYLIISTSGDIIPFTILIGKPGSKPRYQVVGKANGSLSSGPIEP